MSLKSTRMEYDFADASGYTFRVVATKVAGEGWNATVTMGSYGYKTPEDAIGVVRAAAAHFVRMSANLKEGT